MRTPSSSALASLCEALGLAARYTDARGQEREVPPEALRALAAALGYPAADDAQARQSLARLRARETVRWLPPVHVVREGERVELRLGEGRGEPPHRWRLQCESGSTGEGEVAAGRIDLPETLPLGYHRLQLLSAEGVELTHCEIIVCPHRCHVPPALQRGERLWGVTVQLYALRSARQWGMGDFTDLRHLVESMALLGAAFVGLNPLHALFPENPDAASPYSPSSRSALNVLYIDVEAAPEFADCEAAQRLVRDAAFHERLRALRERDEVDYAGVAALKLPVLGALYECFRERHLLRDTHRARAFRQFQRGRGATLRAHAVFAAIQARLQAEDPALWGWPAWPEPWRDPEGETVRRFVQEHPEAVEYQEYLQWLADEQLQAVRERAESLGMAIGLYRDLAVGSSEGGSDTWSAPSLYALGTRVGAPPDALNPAGQDWGLPPWQPQALRERAYKPFVQLLRSNMRHAGALRVDHAMALMRLYCVPPGHPSTEGAYLHYPMRDLFAILALESQRCQCLVIGEDLGTVPPEVRDAMREHAVLSYCPLYFERDEQGRFRAPADWPEQALAVVGTHDLPTLAGFWAGQDLRTRRELGLYPEASMAEEQALERAADRAHLLLALEREGLVAPGSAVQPPPHMDEALACAVHEYLGRSRAWLVGLQLEDVCLQLEPVNVPGTTDERPNWRLKLAVPLEDLPAEPRLHAIARAVTRARPRGAAPGLEAWPPLATALVPRATYRVQFHAGFRFADAERVLPYLADLGVSHLYASPYLKARAGSTHGYDVVDHNALNPEIGDEADFERLCSALEGLGLMQLLDIVPNHMGVLGSDNAWWLDVLEHGPASLHAETFDIDWQAPAAGCPGKVLLPLLGAAYGEVLERGELKLVFDGAAGSFHVAYHEHRLPLDPRDYAQVLSAAPLPLRAAQSEDARTVARRVQHLADAFAALPARDNREPGARARRLRDQAVLKQELARLASEHEWVRAWIDTCVRAFDAGSGEARRIDALDALIQRQAWRPAWWRVAGDEVNYRRFFDINTLAAVRMEREPVFEATHRTLLRWLQEGKIHGLRIDHPDGLSDPPGYFRRLQARHAAAMRATGAAPRALYLVIEKILGEHEHWPSSWPVHGDTGYRFVAQSTGLFIDARHEAAFDELYARFAGRTEPVDELLYEAKHHIMATALAADLTLLTESAWRIAQGDRRTRDHTRNGLRTALAEIAAAFPVYRTYIGEEGASDVDRQHLDWACAKAARRCDAAVVEYLRQLMLHAADAGDAARRQEQLAFVRRFQQFTAPVMAKAMEDTVFYRYLRLVALNEVGADPRHFGFSPAAFHAANVQRLRYLPHTLLGSSTHDTKRGEDVRMRLAVLSEMPQRWAERVQRWAELQRRHARALAPSAVLPHPNDEYLLYQTLVGAWPFEDEGFDAEALAALRGRIQAYMLKAVREAKERTSWTHPDEAYEAGLAHYIDTLLGQLEPNPVLGELRQFVREIAPFGAANSVAMVTLKFTSPGVPDVYQGCEDWNLSLVDPDNRRPVDFDRLQRRLAEVRELYAPGAPTPDDWRLLWTHLGDGRLKMLVTWRLLQLRREHELLWRQGSYVPLSAEGPRAEHVVAYARAAEGRCVVTAVARLSWSLAGGALQGWAAAWEDTVLPLPAGGRWRELYTGRVWRLPAGGPRLRLRELLVALPAAVLVHEEASA